METATPAPAPTPEQTTRTAVADAVSRGDMRAFHQAEQARKLGKPLADVTIESPDAPQPDAPSVPGQTPVRAVSKRQEKTNDAIREAVDRATTELRAEIERLKSAPARTEPLPTTTIPPEPQKPIADYKRYLAMPDAPKLKDFEGSDNPFEEHAAAMALFIADSRDKESRSRSEVDQVVAAKQARTDRFIDAIAKARAADPEFVNRMTPKVRALKPFDAIPRDAQGRFLEPSSGYNVVAEHLFDSEFQTKLLEYFSTPEGDKALDRLATVPDHLKSIPASARIAAHMSWIAREFGKIEAKVESETAAAPSSTTTEELVVPDLPEPPASTRARTTEPSDPALAAVKRGDVRAFRKAELEKRAARLTGRR